MREYGRAILAVLFCVVAIGTLATTLAVFGRTSRSCARSAGSQPEATVVGYRFEDWCIKQPLSLCVDPVGGPAMDRPLVDYVREAMDTWNLVAKVPLPLSISGSCPGAGTAAGDGRNVVGWRTLDPGVDGMASVEAVHGSVDEADVWLDIPPDVWNGPPPCLRAILLHELGHVLGLDHQPEQSSIMHPQVTCDQTVPSGADAAAVRFLY
jgi:hypothetical protein